METLQKKLGKKVEPLTRAEIKANEYRAKKGLPPLKKKNISFKPFTSGSFNNLWCWLSKFPIFFNLKKK